MSIQTVEISLPESIIKVIEIRQGPVGGGGGGSNSITSATTSDGTANLSLSNITTATATVTSTLTADHIHGNLAGNVYGHVRAGENLAKGDPVYISGSHGSGSTLIPIVSKADSSNAAKMPAVGVMDAAVLANANGHMVIVGTITELDTNAYTVNSELYVASGGGFTATPPTARAQPVARVERVNLNNGAIIVKVNGLSASDATASTLVRRTSDGGASFYNVVCSELDVGSGKFQASTLGNITLGSGATVNFNATTYTYGTGAASAHRIALGASTVGNALFTAADAAAARTTLMGEILKYDPNAAAPRVNPATQANDDVLNGINLTAGLWEISYYVAFDTGTCGYNTQLILGTPASGDMINTARLGWFFVGNGTQNPVTYTTATGVFANVGSASALSNWQITGTFIAKISGNTTLALQYARSSNVALETITRRAGAFLRARKIN